MGFSDSFINKSGVITPSSFAAPSALSKDEANLFIDYVVDQSFMKANARVERMNAPTKTIAKVGIGNNILKPAKSAIDPGNTVSFVTDQLTLETKEIIAIAEVSDDSLEDNIEGDAFVDHLMKMIAAQSANELDLMCMYGKRIASPNDATDIKQLVNGWITSARELGHTLDARDLALFPDMDAFTQTIGTTASGYIDPAKLSRTLKTLPNKYRGNKASLRYLFADNIYQDYNDFLGARSVATADPYLLGMGNNLTYSNIKIQPVALMPTDRPVIKVGGGSSTLTNSPAVGSNLLQMTSTASMTAGDALVIDFCGGYEEVVTIASVTNGTDLTIVGGLYYSHTAGQSVKECVTDGCEMLLTDYRNLIFGIQRDIKWETERHARRRSTSFIMTLRVDTQIENPDAMVLMSGLKFK
jgi:plastocyanin